MAMITVNHVFSSETSSQIFDDLMDRFEAHGETFVYLRSVHPLQGALVRHYHRPNLESRLIRPAVVTVHHDLAETDDWLQFEKFEQQYRDADRLVCLNNAQIEFLKSAGIDQTVRVPHGYDPALLQPVHRRFAGDRKIALGFFSRRYPRKVKGEAHLLELLKRLDPEKFSLLFIGQDRTLDARQARLLGFEARAYERVPYAVLASAYRQIDLLLIASLFEGGPASIPEAIATATPVASTPVGMARDHVQEGINGLFLTQDPQYDAARLGALHEDPSRLEKLFDGAWHCAQMARPWDWVVKRHEAIYRDLLRTLVGDA